MNVLEILGCYTIASFIATPAVIATVQAVGAIQAHRNPKPTSGDRFAHINRQHPNGYRLPKDYK